MSKLEKSKMSQHTTLNLIDALKHRLTDKEYIELMNSLKVDYEQKKSKEQSIYTIKYAYPSLEMDLIDKCCECDDGDPRVSIYISTENVIVKTIDDEDSFHLTERLLYEVFNARKCLNEDIRVGRLLCLDVKFIGFL